MALVRSLRRTARHLDRTLSEIRRSSPPPPPPSADSRIRPRMRCALIVSENERARRVLIERLAAAGFYVEWARTAHDARTRAERSEPDVLLIDHSANEALKGEVTRALACAGARQHAIVVTVDRFPGNPSSERSVTVVELRNPLLDGADVVGCVARAISVPR
jgi:CheY-like chemotaxis protein